MIDDQGEWVSRTERLHHIINCAREVFIEEGFAGASMSTIASRVGGSKSTLYTYFRSKESLFSAVIKYECERKNQDMVADVDSTVTNVTDVLRTFAIRYVRVILDEENMLFTRLLVAESSRRPELSKIFYDSGPRRIYSLMVAYIESQIEAGRMIVDEPLTFIQQFCALSLGDALIRRLMNIDLPDSKTQLIKNVDAAIDLMFSRYPLRTKVNN